jgi:hypothetical protein
LVSQVTCVDFVCERGLLLSLGLDQTVLVWAMCPKAHLQLSRCLTIGLQGPLPALLLFSEAQ